MDARKPFLALLLSLVAFLTAVDADCDQNLPIGEPVPDGVVSVKYQALITQIELPENYPQEPDKSIRIGVFNCDESDVPVIGIFTSGTSMSLGLTTEKESTKYYLVMNNVQDYETPSQRYYRFSVLAGTRKLDVVVRITNVDDEFPYFSVPDPTPCIVTETFIGQTSCYLLANDPDAIMDGMKYRVKEGENESKNFSLVEYGPVTPTDSSRTVAIYKKAAVEFIDKPVYSFLLEVEDPAGHVANLSYIVQITAENKEMPHFTPLELEVELDEETPGIVLTDQTITVEDRDALEFGQFYITLEGGGSDNCYEAFDVIPKAGYRSSEVKLSVIDPKKLDYDEGSCNDIIVKIRATEINDVTRFGEVQVNVRLNDLNDEPPIFVQDEYVFSTEEHTAKGTPLGVVNATDRDAFDTVSYSLGSNMFLTVDPKSGEVTVNGDLNYGRQPTVYATVKAEDTATPPHFAYAQITVDVIDINDERPLLNMPWGPWSFDEVTPSGTVLNITFTATDPDTNPDLLLIIDWDTSRATKQGFPVKKEEFEDCLEIETVRDPGDPNNVEGVLKINKEIHWEVFEILYLNIFVDDNNTDPRYQQNRNSSAMLTITINDINDCAPEFGEVKDMTFKENTEEGQLFGIIVATDKDGPGFNEVTYYLTDELYEEKYITIHSVSGELRTGKDPIDFEQIQEIMYTVVATDGLWNTSMNITIRIEDVNDCTPYFLYDYSTLTNISVPENTNVRTDLLQFLAKDDDISPEFHTLTFFVEDQYKRTFQINSSTGLMFIPDGVGDDLDYETDHDFTIQITARDRCENINSCYFDSLINTTRITVYLTDVNDNAPVIQNGGLLRTIAEDEGKKGVQLGYVIATDADSTINADLTFEFVSFDPEKGQELFTITKIDPLRASILVKNDLIDNWGEYTLTVRACDIGPLCDTKDFIIAVTDVNNNEPKFVYPDETTSLRFNIEGNIPGVVLSDVNGKEMIFSAIDDIDNGLNGTKGMTYAVTGDVTATEYLEMAKNELRLIKDFDENIPKQFKLQLEACDGDVGAPKQCTKIEVIVRIRININYEPTFDVSEWETNFTENSTGLTEVRRIDVKVTDLNNVDDCEGMEDDCQFEPIYYFIYIGDKETFALEKETGDLSLLKELDREEVDTHSITVAVTNWEKGPQGQPQDNSMLTITIHVNDVIDNPPQFTKQLFSAGINLNDKIGISLTTLTAISLDLNDELTYGIVPDTMRADDDSLQHLVNRDPFTISNDQLQLNFDLQDPTMKGSFTFQANVTNLGNFTDVAQCQIYIISEQNIVTTRFLNDKPFVESKKKEIADIYTRILKYQCNIKTVAAATDSSGSAIVNVTDVALYFVDENSQEPVSTDTIIKLLNDKTILTVLQQSLYAEELVLDSMANGLKEEVASTEGVLQTVLIGVSVVLGVLVVVLFAAFFFRTRSLNRRLEALSTTKFGSHDSGLNRIGLSVPNTNQHAVEGSNPVWGNDNLMDRDFDNMSQSSGDSDLIGVEENPEFRGGIENDGFTPEFDTRRMSVNPMYAPDLNTLSPSAPLQENTTVNPLAGTQNIGDYYSENDTGRSSETVASQNNNFTFQGRMDSLPITQL